MPSAELARFIGTFSESTRPEQDGGLIDARRIRKADVELVYEALFLRGITGFEVFLEELFISILLGRTTYGQKSRVINLMCVVSKNALMGILLQEVSIWIGCHTSRREPSQVNLKKEGHFRS